MPEDVEETNSGVKKKGGWKEVAEFGEEVEEAMEQSEIDEESVEKFRDWRPKQGEAENDMKKKTVDKAVVEEKEVEEMDDGVREGLKEASGKVAEAGKKARNGERAESEMVDASEDVAAPLVSGIVKLFRRFESMVYSRFSLRDDRYYLDTEDFSVDMKSKNGEYEMDVNFPTESPKKQLRRGMEDMSGGDS
ncbi:MAG: DUF5828 family protein [Candidatus Nanohaloarchaea archaeon]